MGSSRGRQIKYLHLQEILRDQNWNKKGNIPTAISDHCVRRVHSLLISVPVETHDQNSTLSKTFTLKWGLLFNERSGLTSTGHSLSKTKNSVPLVLKRIIPTELAPLVGEVSAKFLRIVGVAWSAQRIPTAVNLRLLYPEPLLFHSSSSSVILTRLSGPRSLFLYWG
jgi:hypothetical protein